jgi:hypothetical protein
MSRPPSEKIIISAPGSNPGPPRADQELAYKHKKHWRSTTTGLTPLGGLLAFFCIMIVVLAPRTINRVMTRGFWNTPYGSTRSRFYSDYIYWVLLDEDYGHIGSYALGIILAASLFYSLSQLLETLGHLVFREGSASVSQAPPKDEP